MISDGDVVYVPFWVIQEYLDAAAPTPFIACKVLKRYTTQTINTSQDAQICDLEIKSGLEATAIPVEYLIEKHDLKEWSEKIGNWFLQYED